MSTTRHGDESRTSPPEEAARPRLQSDAATPRDTSVRCEVDVVHDVRIPTTDADVSLSADVYRPVCPEPVPALVMVMPYRKDMDDVAASLRWLAKRGYASLVVDMLGTGSSDGVMRRPFDAAEADDGVAAIDWAAAQPWCTGDVGMWGASYMSLMTMRTASRRPAALKAIVPIVGSVDIERDFVHPEGVRGGFASVAWWALGTLGGQLLPPVREHHSLVEQQRWRRRVEEAEPYIVDLFRHGPADPVWRERAVDASAITTPSLCVAGWHDLFCDGAIRAYEEIQAPKKLIVGPWMHGGPQETIDFMPIMLRWFDYWLRGVDTGIMEEPAVSLFVQGKNPGWRGYDAWPPAETATPVRSLEGLAESIEYVPDPTTGALSGLWSSPASGYGAPLDQHDDDARSVSVTSVPLPDDLLLAGRPHVTVTLASMEEGWLGPERIVVRLADVDPQGRSTMITSGLLGSVGPGSSQRVLLWPTGYRVAAGHRLRVVVSDSDFPRLWPVVDAVPWRVSGIKLAVPTPSESLGKPLDYPPPEPPDAENVPVVLLAEPRWEINRDHIHNGIEVVHGTAATTRPTYGAELLTMRRVAYARVQRDAPEAAHVQGTYTISAQLDTGEAVEVAVEARVTGSAMWARGEVTIDGTMVVARTWSA